jgi:hypothetical protein
MFRCLSTFTPRLERPRQSSGNSNILSRNIGAPFLPLIGERRITLNSTSNLPSGMRKNSLLPQVWSGGFEITHPRKGVAARVKNDESEMGYTSAHGICHASEARTLASGPRLQLRPIREKASSKAPVTGLLLCLKLDMPSSVITPKCHTQPIFVDTGSPQKRSYKPRLSWNAVTGLTALKGSMPLVNGTCSNLTNLRGHAPEKGIPPHIG